jgi:hypothetical protein
VNAARRLRNQVRAALTGASAKAQPQSVLAFNAAVDVRRARLG